MRKIGKSLIVLGASVALIFAGSSSANAINRVSCTDSNFLQISSAQATCWANAGTVDVKLYGVYGFNTGNNAGAMVGIKLKQVFAKKSIYLWHENNTIIRITIN